MRTIPLCLLLGIATVGLGCQTTGFYVNRTLYKASQNWSAEKAWRSRKGLYADVPCRRRFKAGFKAGYRFANGGYDSCEPPMAKHFWRINGITSGERAEARAWSDGFTHGTLAAQQDGAVGASAYDTAAVQPPEGVPDVSYLVPPPSQYGMEDPSNGMQFAPNAMPDAENVPPPNPDMPQSASPQGVWLIPSSIPPQTIGPQVMPLPQTVPPSIAGEPSLSPSAALPAYTSAPPQNPVPPEKLLPAYVGYGGRGPAAGIPVGDGVQLSIHPSVPVAPLQPGIGSLRAAARIEPPGQNSLPVVNSQLPPGGSMLPSGQPLSVQPSAAIAPGAQAPGAQSPAVQSPDWQMPVIHE